TSTVRRVRFTPDGTQLISSSDDGRLILWSPPPPANASPPATPDRLAAWLARLTTAAIQPDHPPATPPAR
ncbi:MAG: WD40 repeat domain-containing protein, partial [bacterium]